jgi:hypothetical protein
MATGLKIAEPGIPVRFASADHRGLGVELLDLIL